MRCLRLALFTVAVGLLAACTGNTSTTNPAVPNGAAGPQLRLPGGNIPLLTRSGSLIPQALRPAGNMPLHGRVAPQGVNPNGGIYASEFYGTDVFGYQHLNTMNNPPECTTSIGDVNPQDIATDVKGNLIVPESYDNVVREILVFSGPSMCGPQLGMLEESDGTPVDAASRNAASGTIAIANQFDGGNPGSISVCTLAGGCTANLTNANMYEVAGVAMDTAGNCWASAETSTETATLTYFKNCKGSGQAATGFQNKYFGGLDVDKHGNLVSISTFDGKVYVYSGCKPGCTLAGGPFTLQGLSAFGHLNHQSMTFAAADFQFGQIDVYQYNSPSSLNYYYSFNNGLSATNLVEGVAFNPRAR